MIDVNHNEIYKWNTMEQKNEMLKTHVMIKNRKACNKVKT